MLGLFHLKILLGRWKLRALWPFRYCRRFASLETRAKFDMPERLIVASKGSMTERNQNSLPTCLPSINCSILNIEGVDKESFEDIIEDRYVLYLSISLGFFRFLSFLFFYFLSLQFKSLSSRTSLKLLQRKETWHWSTHSVLSLSSERLVAIFLVEDKCKCV